MKAMTHAKATAQTARGCRRMLAEDPEFSELSEVRRDTRELR
jgi:hypothetical protein